MQGNQLSLFQEPEELSKPLELRDYQLQVIADVYRYFKLGLKSVLLYAPTGSGKTVVSARITADAVQKGRRVLFLCHRQKLISQTQKTLKRNFNIDAGIIWAGHQTDYSLPVQIGMIQTIQNRQLPPDIGLVIFDEAHSSIYFKICYEIMLHYSGGIVALSPCYFLGLSASPWRLRSKEGYCQFFQAIARSPDLNELVKQNYLVRPRLFGYGGLIDFSQLETENGDYSEKSMSLQCDSEYNATVVEKFLEICPERKAIAFCASVAQASDLARQFNESGIESAVIVGTTSEFQRELIYKKFNTGEIQIISSVGVLCEGFDEPSVQAAIIARPTRSKALLVQMCGRALRLHPNKQDAYLLDFGECFQRCVDIRRKLKITLCPNNRPDPPGMLKECPECHEQVWKFARVCPECGYEFPMGDGNNLDEDGDIPDFGELLTEEEKKALGYIRGQMKKAFNAGRNPGKVRKLFYEKFNYPAPEEWFVGAIFGMKNPEINKRIYYDFLMSQFATSPKHPMIKELFLLEFGRPERVYKTKSGNIYKSPRFDFSNPVPWHQVLGVSKSANWDAIKARYRQLAQEFHPDVSEDEQALQKMQLINWAFDRAKTLKTQG